MFAISSVNPFYDGEGRIHVCIRHNAQTNIVSFFTYDNEQRAIKHK